MAVAAAAFFNIFTMFLLGTAVEKIENKKLSNVLAIICYFTGPVILFWNMYFNMPETPIVALIIGIINVIAIGIAAYLHLKK